MESIIQQLSTQQVWEDLLAYRLRKGRFNWHEFDEADDFVANGQYMPMALKLINGERMGVPRKIFLNKIGSNKKRVVYLFEQEEVTFLKMISYLLYKYDSCFAPNCYAFRRGVRACDAVRRIQSKVRNRRLWAYKVDISNYFNSISVPLLLPKLKTLLADDTLLFHFFEQLLNENRAESDGVIVEEPHGVMAGVPTAPFLANVYLSDMDFYFWQKGVIYARYSDDIIVFAEDECTLQGYKATIAQFLRSHHLEINQSKEQIYSPDDSYEFLGFKCLGGSVDISTVAVKKMKMKIRRKMRALLRWKKRKGISDERVMSRMIAYFNHKFFESVANNTLTWSRWYFPVINRVEGLHEIDCYLQYCIRVLSTGRHVKSNYRVTYERLKELGYKSLVHEYYKYKESRQ